MPRNAPDGAFELRPVPASPPALLHDGRVQAPEADARHRLSQKHQPLHLVVRPGAPLGRPAAALCPSCLRKPMQAHAQRSKCHVDQLCSLLIVLASELQPMTMEPRSGLGRVHVLRSIAHRLVMQGAATAW